MAFTPDFLDELRARVPLAATIGRRAKLIKRGREYVALCPFHSEKTPSFTVNEDKGFFHCFGCQAHGDVIGFVMRADNLSFPEAVARLAGEAGLELPAPAPDDPQRTERMESLHAVVEAACVWFEAQLAGEAGKAARAYLVRRGVGDETVAEFRLGYAPPARGALKQALAARGFSQEIAVEAGLLAAPEDGDEVYDRFRDRVIFPIADRRGRVVAFGGRALGEAKAKYLNSPETPLFHKGRLLYNLARARGAAREAGTILVAEGYTDVLALSAAGFRHVVAPMGTALTEAQMQELWRLAPEPVLCLDGDAAGRRAAYRAAEHALPLLKPGHSLSFALLPAGEDPDSLIAKRGAQAMAEQLARAAPLSDVLWAKEVADRSIDTPERRAGFERGLYKLVAEIRDETVRQYYRRHFKNRLWEVFREQTRSTGRRWRPVAADRISDAATLTGGLDRNVRRREELLLLSLMNHPELIARVGGELAGLELQSADLEPLRRELVDIAERRLSLDSAGLKVHLSERGLSQSVDRLANRQGNDLDWFAAADAALEDAEMGWGHTLARYRRDVHSRARLEAAQKEYEESMTPESEARFLAVQRELLEGVGDEAEIESYGVASGRGAND